MKFFDVLFRIARLNGKVQVGNEFSTHCGSFHLAHLDNSVDSVAGLIESLKATPRVQNPRMFLVGQIYEFFLVEAEQTSYFFVADQKALATEQSICTVLINEDFMKLASAGVLEVIV